MNGAYTDAKYVRFVDAPCPPELSGGTTVGAGQTPSAPGTPGGLSPANCDISGQRLAGVSEWSFSFGAEANAPGNVFGQAGQFYLAMTQLPVGLFVQRLTFGGDPDRRLQPVQFPPWFPFRRWPQCLCLGEERV